MTFAVSSPVGRSGKITVRAPTPEAALAWVGKLRDSNRAEVIITSIATGVQLSEELKARVLKHDLNGGNERSLNAVLHRMIRFFNRIYIVMIGPARGSPLVLEASERSEGA